MYWCAVIVLNLCKRYPGWKRRFPEFLKRTKSKMSQNAQKQGKVTRALKYYATRWLVVKHQRNGCYLLNKRGDLSFSRINALFEPLYLCCRTQKRNCVWEKIKIIKKTEHVGITCTDEITSSSQSRTRGIFCPVSFKRCACAISKNYVLSFDHTLNTARVKHSGKSLRFCAKKLDGSLKRIISFNNNTSLF